jgi:hypothetical protein
MHRARRTSRNAARWLRLDARRAHEARRPESSTVESRDRHPRVVDSSRDRHAPAELEALFHSASGVPADRREAWIESQCARGVPRELARRAAALAARVDDSRDIEPVSRSSQDEARVVRPLAQGPTSRAAFAAGAGLALVLAPHAASTSLSKTITSERNEMIAIRAESVLAAAAAASIAAAATAQDAVQWRVEDGGNGHWYQLLTNQQATFWQAVSAATSRGGHLVSISSQNENAFVRQISVGYAVHFGAFHDPAASGWSEPSAGWTWVSGEPWSWSGWCSGQPDNSPWGGFTGQELARFASADGACWDDAHSMQQISTWAIETTMVEWSSDCNDDGLVDYGQIRAGELVDVNSNNIPDCCEQGFDCRFNAVEWQVADGGNGHWYELKLSSSGLSWASARTEALMRGGQLATGTSVAECEFIFEVAQVEAAWTQNRYVGPWLGGMQSSAAPGFAEPAGGWAWDSGESWDFTNWDSFNPSNGPSGREDFLHLAGYSAKWNDIRQDGEGNVRSAIIEYAADCNNDGLVDYGQIRAGELDDANLNNIPDCCEAGTPCGCPGDIDRSGEVNGVDLAIVLQAWGGSKQYPEADLDGDGTVNGSDLATVLNSWGACP